MSRNISNHPHIKPTWQTNIEPNFNWNTKWQFIYRNGWTYIWQMRLISDRADIYLTWQTYIEPFLYFEPKRRFIYRHGWTNNVISTSCAASHDIYRIFRLMRVCPTYELPIRHMRCHFLSNWNYGWICEPVSDVCHQKWQLIWTGWHDKCAAISHKKTKMTAHMRANPT